MLGFYIAFLMMYLIQGDYLSIYIPICVCILLFGMLCYISITFYNVPIYICILVILLYISLLYAFCLPNDGLLLPL